MRLKNKWLLIVFGCVGISNLVITYFGRIYYPINFMPETVSFTENFLVLFAGMLMCSIPIVLFVGIFISEFIEFKNETTP